jgi:hypothetical protein
MFGVDDDRWWTDDRIELLMQLRHEHHQPWPVVTKLLGAKSEIAAMRKYYLLLQQSHERIDRRRVHADNLARILGERQKMLKPGQPMSVADPGFKLMKRIVEVMK